MEEINNINTEVFWRDKATPKSRIKNKMERRTKLFIISEGEKISKNWKPTIVPNTVKDPRIDEYLTSDPLVAELANQDTSPKKNWKAMLAEPKVKQNRITFSFLLKKHSFAYKIH